LNDYQNGVMYGYNYRPADYSTITNGSLCSNNQVYNGIIFGKFKCPIEGYDLDEFECCDKADQQFCCKTSILLASTMLFNIIIAVVCSMLLCVLIPIVIVVFSCYCKKTHQSVPTIDE